MGHRSQGKAVEATDLPPFEPPGKYLEQRKEALTHGAGALIGTETLRHKGCRDAVCLSCAVSEVGGAIGHVVAA